MVVKEFPTILLGGGRGGGSCWVVRATSVVVVAKTDGPAFLGGHVTAVGAGVAETLATGGTLKRLLTWKIKTYI